MPRCTCRYRSRRKEVPGLRKRLLELAAERKRFGAPKLYLLLRREGFMVNHKRVERLSNEEGLWGRKRIRKRMKGAPRQALQPPVKPNQQWAMDFVSDALAEVLLKDLAESLCEGLEGGHVPRIQAQGLSFRPCIANIGKYSLCLVLSAVAGEDNVMARLGQMDSRIPS